MEKNNVVLHDKTKRRGKAKEWLLFISFVAFPLIQFLIFYVAVNFNSILLAFQTYSADGTVRWGFDNFARIFSETNFQTVLHSLRNSGIFFAVRVFVGMSLGMLFSYYIFKMMPGHNFFKVMLFIPTIVSSVVMVIIYELGSEHVLPYLVTGSRYAAGYLQNPDTRFITVIIYNIWVGFGTQVLMYLGAMNSVSDGALEAAKIDGVNAVQEFTHVIFPGIYPTFVVFMTVNVVEIFTHQMALHTFFGFKELDGTSMYTLGYYLYREVGLAEANTANLTYPAALGVLCTIIAVPLVVGIRKLMTKFGPSES